MRDKMLAFTIMLWFVTIILVVSSVMLFRGNVAALHGKVFNNIKDKSGYGKALAKPILLMAVGFFAGGLVTLLISDMIALIYAMAVVVVSIIVALIWFFAIQNKFKNS